MDFFKKKTQPLGFRASWMETEEKGKEEIAEIESKGENPYAMTFSPDGNYLVVSNYTGDVDGFATNTTLSIIDISPESDTQYSLVTQVVNK